jgi:hypothetical protein
MAMDSSANLLFQITADSSDAESNVKRFRALLSKDLEGLKGEVSGWFTSIFGEVKNLQGALLAGGAGALAGITALAAGAVKIGEELWAAGEKAAHYAEEIEKGTEKTGLSAEAVSGLRYAARNAELGYDELVGSLVKFEVAIAKAQDPTSNQAKMFARLGVTQKDLQQSSQDLLPVLYKVADEFRSHADGVWKATTAREAFGKTGADMIEFLNMGSVGMRKFAEDAERMGLVLTEQDLVAAKAFRLEMTALSAEIEGVKLSLGKDAIPYMRGFAVVVDASLRSIGKANQESGGWWKFLLPPPLSAGAMAIAFAKELETELPAARKRLEDRLRAAMADAGAGRPTMQGAGAEAQEATENWRGFSDILEQVRQRLAGTEGEEAKIGAETDHLNYLIQKAGEELDKLKDKGSILPEALKREMAALAELPGMVGQLSAGAWKQLAEKRTAAVSAATADLEQRIQAQQEETYENRVKLWNAEIDKLQAKLNKEHLLTAQNEQMIVQLRKQGIERIQRDQEQAFVGELRTLQSQLAEMVTARFTSTERIRWMYDQDLERYSAVE